MGNVWAVKISLEEASSGDGWTELSSNGNGAAAAGHQQAPCCTGPDASCCDFATLGEAYPHGTRLHIFNPGNGRGGVWELTDVGNGSSFGPAIGLTPNVYDALQIGSGSVAHISLADGRDMHVVSGFGSLVSGTDPGGGPTPEPVAAFNPSTIIRHDFFQLGQHGTRAFDHANQTRRLLGGVRHCTFKRPVR